MKTTSDTDRGGWTGCSRCPFRCADTAMQSLFDGGALLAWSKKTVADESVGVKMRASAALALANMARNGKECVFHAGVCFPG